MNVDVGIWTETRLKEFNENIFCSAHRRVYKKTQCKLLIFNQIYTSQRTYTGKNIHSFPVRGAAGKGYN